MKKLGKVKVALLSMAVCAGVIAAPVSAVVNTPGGPCPRCGTESTYTTSAGKQTVSVSICANHNGPHEHTLYGTFYHWNCRYDGYFDVFKKYQETCPYA